MQALHVAATYYLCSAHMCCMPHVIRFVSRAANSQRRHPMPTHIRTPTSAHTHAPVKRLRLIKMHVM